MIYDIKLSKVLKYLRYKGWAIGDYEKLGYKISSTANGEEFEIIIPKKEEVPDYDFRIEQLIKSLSSIEGRNSNTIKREIENIGYDVLKFRFISEQYEGYMPLDNFAEAVDKIYDVIRFEACSELNPQSQYTNLYDEARDLISNCEVPQTDKGSYIINVKVPLGETYLKEIKSDEGYLRFLGRKTIMRTLEGIKEAKDIDLTDERNFKATYKERLNKQSCKALKELIESAKGTKIEINTDWDFSKPLSVKPPEGVKLTEKDRSVFETMEAYLVKIPEEQAKTIQGKLMDMKRKRDNDRELTIIIEDVNLNRNVYVDLREESYELACRLYSKISNVIAKGVLTKRAGRWVLDNYTEFRIQDTLHT